MRTKLTLDKAGRIVVPKPVRHRLGLAPGDQLELDGSDDQITLRPVCARVALRKKHGIWVLGTGVPLSASVSEATTERVRRERDRRNSAGIR
jgi:AbrB family looped-hinge helix DNA binding protein